MMNIVKELKAKFLELEETFEYGKNQEQLVYDLEEEIQNAHREAYEDSDLMALDKLNKKLKAFKRDNDFYDAEGELDRMFPDRHDEGFDEDSMNYDSVFGG
ncbi:hypothetical protein H9W90_10295 [Polaribacter pectinis]|uniref:Uncharacterized protein n=1 Tax=Polaribacter pectinis TaxID=2738844 RepID=A0A7G9L7I7_9FLAO|nr:hypothetical protein [Polaribacter pectinis]QNM84586.1 hypothetical protein H9W90_10295 [Polaribacter pectinis]